MAIRIKNLKAFILCGGKATRLKGLNGDLPKPLMKTHGKPIMAYLLCEIANLFEAIIVCHAHHPNLYHERLLGHVPENILHSISYEKDTEIEGTAFAVQRYLPRGDDFWAIFNGDTLFSNYRSLIPNKINKNEVIFSTSCQEIGRSNVFTQDPGSSLFSVKQNRHGESKDISIVSNGLIFLGPEAVKKFAELELNAREPFEQALLRFQRQSGLLFSNHQSGSEFLDYGTPAEFSDDRGNMSKFISTHEV